MEIKDKNISIIGAVRSGIGAAKLIKKLGGKPFVSDSGSELKLKDSIQKLNDEKIDYEIGQHSEKVFNCELMIVSPGVPSNAEVIIKAREKKIKLVSEIELAADLLQRKSYCNYRNKWQNNNYKPLCPYHEHVRIKNIFRRQYWRSLF